MKKIIIGLIALSSISAFAESYSGVVCKSSAGASTFYHPDGSPAMDGYGITIGCNPAPECAADALDGELSNIPEKGEASYSTFFSKYVEVKQKNLSKLVLDSKMTRTAAKTCVPDTVFTYSVDCDRATACLAANVEYDVCTKVKYDPETGNKIVTCPSGKVIK